MTTEVFVLARSNQRIATTERDDLASSRALLERINQPAYLAGMLCLELLRWLEPRSWDIKVGGWFYVFKFEDPRDAMMFKLTWL